MVVKKFPFGYDVSLDCQDFGYTDCCPDHKFEKSLGKLVNMNGSLYFAMAHFCCRHAHDLLIRFPNEWSLVSGLAEKSRQEMMERLRKQDPSIFK